MFRHFLALTPLLLALGASPAWAGPTDAAQGERRLEEVREQIQALQKTIDRNKAREDGLRREVEDAEKKIAVVQAQLEKLRRQARVQQGRVDTAQAALDEADARLDDQRKALAAQLRAAYVIGQNASTRLLLNLSDVQKVDRMITYYGYLSRTRTARMQGILAQAEQLRALKDKLEEEAGALVSLQAEQETALTRLRSLRSERADQLAKLKARLGDEQSELSQLRDSEREIEKLLESLQKALREVPLVEKRPRPAEPEQPAESGEPALFSDKPFPSLKGKLAWPTRGKLLAAFGQPKAGGRLQWNGHWIAAEAGAPVHAVARGRVVYTGWMHRYGQIVIVEHDGGYFTLYGHNQSVARSAGDPVRAGDVIALAGNTGGHEDNGVYFEVRRGSISLDPKQWLGKR